MKVIFKHQNIKTYTCIYDIWLVCQHVYHLKEKSTGKVYKHKK